MLKDDLAVYEIRRHKWIESEKSGKEIGFATAALDWISHHSRQWQADRISQKSPDDFYCEKRRHRRFQARLPVQISGETKTITTFTDDLNIIGLACVIPDHFRQDEPVRVTISFDTRKKKGPAYRYQFDSRISIKSPLSKGRENLFCRTFIPFNEEVRDFLRLHAPDV